MQVFSKLQKGAALAAAGVVSVVALPARAASSVDLTPITSSISASDITTGVMAIGAVLAVVYVTIKAAKIVISYLKSA
ncbi:major capsid protein [Herbaspirillum rubrisubalbicans]|jgi:crotonobetainyl-CoA:carnitine CoA-transferase CaiB-like acyl-CoA transferase|uniref:major capsid protein n=1 Tax=Herbaspirillum rubrisubalbicans TaxID=80842 RepID=UPI0020A1C689|nr:major capsid protein [Herbaspirillum rubrisubalbicans]